MINFNYNATQSQGQPILDRSSFCLGSGGLRTNRTSNNVRPSISEQGNITANPECHNVLHWSVGGKNRARE